MSRMREFKNLFISRGRSLGNRGFMGAIQWRDKGRSRSAIRRRDKGRRGRTTIGGDNLEPGADTVEGDIEIQRRCAGHGVSVAYMIIPLSAQARQMERR